MARLWFLRRPLLYVALPIVVLIGFVGGSAWWDDHHGEKACEDRAMSAVRASEIAVERQFPGVQLETLAWLKRPAVGSETIGTWWSQRRVAPLAATIANRLPAAGFRDVQVGRASNGITVQADSAAGPILVYVQYGVPGAVSQVTATLGRGLPYPRCGFPKS